jgi:hypothetical protein
VGSMGRMLGRPYNSKISFSANKKSMFCLADLLIPQVRFCDENPNPWQVWRLIPMRWFETPIAPQSPPKTIDMGLLSLNNGNDSDPEEPSDHEHNAPGAVETEVTAVPFPFVTDGLKAFENFPLFH